MSPLPETPSRRPFAAVLAVAIVLGAVETVKGYLAGRSAPNEFGWSEAFITNMPWWLMWALVAPVIFLLVRRFPLGRANRARAGTIHLLVSVVLALLHLAASALIAWVAVAHTFTTLGEVTRDFVMRYLVTDIVSYWAILAAYSTWMSYRRLDQAERESQALELRAAQLEAESVKLNAQMTEARLDALRLELNPHFLFNTLNAVSALARRGDSETAVEVLARLSELLRCTLDGERDQEVPLDDELRLLDRYLAIERTRFGERLTIGIAVVPDVRHALVPSLVLQPLVENAVRHGLSAIRGPVRIELSARRCEESLEIVVADNGRGFADPDGPVVEGVGLRNTRSRLRALYGEEAGIEFMTPAGGGAAVRMHLPFRPEAGVRVDS